jgi:type VI protein secretion system component VasK
MVTLDLGAERGGTEDFEHVNAIADYAEAQATLWAGSEELKSAFGELEDSLEVQSLLIGPWHALSRFLDAMSSRAARTPLEIEIRDYLKSRRPIAYDSLIGTFIRTIAVESGAKAAVGAMKVSQETSDVTSISKLNVYEAEGADRLKQMLHDAQTARLDQIDTMMGRLLASTDARIQDLKTQIADVEQLTEKVIHRFNATTRQYDDEFKNFVADQATEHGNKLAEWDGRYEAARKAILERTQIKKPVALWAALAKKHEFAYRVRAGLALLVGVGGLAAAFLVTKFSYGFAEDLFTDALAANRGTGTGALRATWLHELIFTASATLLYLTVYLWITRILVRMMLSEHHLAVDARSREAMADTYLGLIAENSSVNENDRAIILASLFRPVTDGLVKDDALPLISPAAIISGKILGGGT